MDDEPFAHRVEVALPLAIENHRVTYAQVEEITKDLPKATNVAGEDDIAAFTRVGRTLMLTNRKLGHLPDRDPQSILLNNIPTNLDNFRINLNRRENRPLNR